MFTGRQARHRGCLPVPGYRHGRKGRPVSRIGYSIVVNEAPRFTFECWELST